MDYWLLLHFPTQSYWWVLFLSAINFLDTNYLLKKNFPSSGLHNWGLFCPPGNIWQHLYRLSDCHDWGIVVLASSGWRPGYYKHPTVHGAALHSEELPQMLGWEVLLYTAFLWVCEQLPRSPEKAICLPLKTKAYPISFSGFLIVQSLTSRTKFDPT